MGVSKRLSGTRGGASRKRAPAERKAGTGIAIAITGIDEIDRRLKMLAPAIQKKVFRQAMRPAMKLVQAKAKSNARYFFRSPTPSGGSSKSTGATVRGIKVRATKSGRKRVGIDVRVNKGAYVDKTFYAAFHEFGTSRMEARPFMGLAYDQTALAARELAMSRILAGTMDQVEQVGSV